MVKMKKGDKTSARKLEERSHLEDPGVDAIKNRLVVWEVMEKTAETL